MYPSRSKDGFKPKVILNENKTIEELFGYWLSGSYLRDYRIPENWERIARLDLTSVRLERHGYECDAINLLPMGYKFQISDSPEQLLKQWVLDSFRFYDLARFSS